jgi:hypothetical protein
LENRLAVSQYNKIRNGLNTESGSQSRVSLRIDLQHQGSAFHLPGQLVNFRRGHFARPAPRGPKVDQNRHSCPGDDLIKCACIDLNWFG